MRHREAHSHYLGLEGVCTRPAPDLDAEKFSSLSHFALIDIFIFKKSIYYYCVRPFWQKLNFLLRTTISSIWFSLLKGAMAGADESDYALELAEVERELRARAREIELELAARERRRKFESGVAFLGSVLQAIARLSSICVSLGVWRGLRLSGATSMLTFVPWIWHHMFVS